jgi:hypothetical protein
MIPAPKVFDWHGQSAAELAREFAALPHGRYLIISEAGAPAEPPDASRLPGAVEAVNEGVEAAKRDELYDWSDVGAELDAQIATSPRGRSR